MPAPVREWREALDYAATSDVGLRRANNQDSYVVVVSPEELDWLRRGDLFMVADGMGAHAAGELASKMATDFVSLTYYKTPDESPVEAIQKAFQDANERVFTRGQSNADFRGMGTTSSALLLLPEGAVVAHVGDSRVYRLRNNRLDQLSFDHSLVWEMQATGKMRDSEIQLNVPKNIITRSLGPYPQVQVDLEGPFAVEAGDAFLLCSDGLSGQVEDDEIGCILGTLPPTEAIQTLVDLANLRGGPDNITVIAVRVLRPLTAANAEELGPARSRPTNEREKVHLAAWITLAVLVLVALSMAFLQKLAVAAAAGIAAALAGGFIAMQQASLRSAGRLEGAQLGKGPYRSVNCAPSAPIVERLAKVVKQLRDAAMEEGWQIDWNKFNTQVTRAATAAQRHDFTESVREYCHALTSIMEQLRHQGKNSSQ
ncbi:MAG TPA: PP2C family serine/threonine-protein phosphatase [Pirellulales bacterium]|nr:PP2C family serine/threonine-protein phosphatase [Pirellulales bacterium]